MTRDEAITKVTALYESAPIGEELTRGYIAILEIDTLVALGLLKLDEPMSVEDQACIVLNRAIGPVEASIVLKNLKDSGFKIVKA